MQDLENNVKETEEKSIALTLWGFGGSGRSLWCSIDKNDYLEIVHSSIVKRKNNIPVASISLIKRSYLFNKKKIIFYAMHRMIAFKDTGNLIFDILVSIFSNKEDNFIATSANEKATNLYKSLAFEELNKVFLHTYLLNPIYLPLLVLFSSITSVKKIIFRVAKKYLPNFYERNYLNKIKNQLKEHIHLRNSNLSNVENRTYIDWDCPTLIKYLKSLIKSFRINIYKLNLKDGKKFSLLITTRFNHVWRSCTIADSTYRNISFSDILNKYQRLLVLSCLNNGAIRLYIRSLDSKSPLRGWSFLHIKVQTSSIWIRNGKGYFSNLSKDDSLSSFHGDSFF